MDIANFAFLSTVLIVGQPSAAHAQSLASVWENSSESLMDYVADGTFSHRIVHEGKESNVSGKFRWERSNEKFFADITFTKVSDEIGDLEQIVPQRANVLGDGIAISECLFNKSHSNGCETLVFPADGIQYKSRLYAVWFDLHRGPYLFFPKGIENLIGERQIFQAENLYSTTLKVVLVAEWLTVEATVHSLSDSQTA